MARAGRVSVADTRSGEACRRRLASPTNVIAYRGVTLSGQPAPHRDDPLDPVAHQIVTTWPPGTFVENLAPLPDGDFVVSLHSRRELARVGRDGSRSTLAHLPVSPVGIVVDGDRLVVGGGEIGTIPQTVFTVGLDGHVQPLVEVPDSLFLNGFTPARAGFVYCVDSLLGVVFEIDLAAASARVVLHHDLLGKISADPMMPGVNGIALGDDALWLTNTDRAVVLRAGLGADGLDGSIDVAAEHLRGDDIALDEHGSVYVTTHIHNTLVRLDPDGRRVALAGPEQGMHGATACAFGVGADDTALYVTTTGGIVMPIDDVPREAKLVRLDVAVRGRPLTARP